MNEQLAAADGHRFDAYIAAPAVKPRGALVVVQEIFGVNSHVRSVADGFASDGYLAIAPALFDRVERGVDLGYADADIQRGFALKTATGNECPLLDIEAAMTRVSGAGKIAVIGYCWGGLLSWLAACSLDGLAASIAYYGGGIPSHAALKARCPVLAHFGDRDSHIPIDTVEAFRAAQPSVTVRVYPALHGFNCDQRASYDAASAARAREVTLAFLRRHLG
jgi:carboxymethylenebutenolidase